MDRINPDFVQQGSSARTQLIETKLQSITTAVVDLKQNRFIADFGVLNRITDLDQLVQQYQTDMETLSAKMVQRGFKDFGDEGALRRSIHAVEEVEFPYDRTYMLTLRRNEKDFIIRKDPKYLEKFNQNTQRFRDHLAALDVSIEQESVRNIILDHLADYQAKFAALVAIEQAIGLDQNSGLQGQLNHTSIALEENLSALEQVVMSHSDASIANVQALLIIVLIAVLLIGVFLTLFLSKRLSRPIVAIKTRIMSLAAGEFPKKFQKLTGGELGKAEDAFNDLLDRLKHASNFAVAVGQGELDAHYDERFSKDVLATSLLEMRGKLHASAEQESQQSWSNKLTAQFGDLMRQHGADTRQLCSKFISQLVTQLGANQGTIFTVNNSAEGEAVLEQQGCYAYDRQKYLQKQIYKGEGLVGQCWQEEELIFVTDVPANYVNITSGLGSATPRCIAIIPMKTNEEVVGVIEIASFRVLETYKIELLQKVAENLGATLASIQVNEETTRLLNQHKELTENLGVQEEELRQQQEEIQAKAEELSHRLQESECDLIAKDEVIEQLRAKLVEQEQVLLN